jgi:hypothetical protein
MPHSANDEWMKVSRYIKHYRSTNLIIRRNELQPLITVLQTGNRFQLEFVNNCECLIVPISADIYYYDGNSDRYFFLTNDARRLLLPLLRKYHRFLKSTTIDNVTDNRSNGSDCNGGNGCNGSCRGSSNGSLCSRDEEEITDEIVAVKIHYPSLETISQYQSDIGRYVALELGNTALIWEDGKCGHYSVIGSSTELHYDYILVPYSEQIACTDVKGVCDSILDDDDHELLLDLTASFSEGVEMLAIKTKFPWIERIWESSQVIDFSRLANPSLVLTGNSDCSDLVKVHRYRIAYRHKRKSSLGLFYFQYS